MNELLIKILNFQIINKLFLPIDGVVGIKVDWVDTIFVDEIEICAKKSC